MNLELDVRWKLLSLNEFSTLEPRSAPLPSGPGFTIDLEDVLDLEVAVGRELTVVAETLSPAF